MVDPPASTVPVYHIVIIRTFLGRNSEDRFLVDAALALQRNGHTVSFITSYLDLQNCFEEVHPNENQIKVLYSGWWMPNSFLGLFSKSIRRFKSFWIGLRLALLPPTPIPKIVILDTDTISLYLLSFFKKYKTFYVQNFPQIKSSDGFYEFIKITPGLFTSKALRCADEIIVQSDCLVEVLKRSFPNNNHQIRTLAPCVDMGLWLEKTIPITRIIPDVPKNAYLFVVFGDYNHRSNFKLALDAMSYMIEFIADKDFKDKLHMVVAGNCNEKSLEQVLYYEELLSATKAKSYGSQMTFLKRLPTIHKKTLIENAIAMVHPTKHDVFPDTILAGMSMGKPIIATNTGFAKEALVHRISAILVETATPRNFAVAMYKIMTSPPLQMFISDMARDAFRKNYCFESFSQKWNNLVLYATDINEFGLK